MDQRDMGFKLEQELGKVATTHPVVSLESKGIRRVRVLDRQRLEDAAKVAINRTLRTQLVGLDLADHTRAEIEQRALAEFSRLVESGTAETEPLPAEVPGSSGEAPPPPVGESMEVIEKRMMKDIGDLLESDWRKEIAQVESNHRNQLELLEQRISKLVRALESTDRVLEHLQAHEPGAAVGSPTESGGALDPNGPLFEKKSQLLSALFQANLELKELEEDESGSDV